MFRLVAIEDTRSVSSAPLVDGDRLGRLATCAFVIAHPSVSRVHARVERRGGDWYLVDAGSRNGLHVRGERVDEVRLASGLELRVGEYALRVEASAPAAPPANAIAESFEFDVQDGAAGGTRAAGRASENAGFELEDPAEIELGRASASQRTDAARRARSEATERGAQSAPAPTPAPDGRSAALVRQAEYLAEEARARSGIVRGELTQQPFWVQGLVWLFVLVFAAAIAWGVSAVLA